VPDLYFYLLGASTPN